MPVVEAVEGIGTTIRVEFSRCVRERIAVGSVTIGVGTQSWVGI